MTLLFFVPPVVPFGKKDSVRAPAVAVHGGPFVDVGSEAVQVLAYWLQVGMLWSDFFVGEPGGKAMQQIPFAHVANAASESRGAAL